MTVDLPADESRWAINTYTPDGQRSRLGKYRLHVTDGHVAAHARNQTVIAEIDVAVAERNGNRWTLTAGDGSHWELATCNCGG